MTPGKRIAHVVACTWISIWVTWCVAASAEKDEAAMKATQDRPMDIATVFDFADGAPAWRSIDDPVMGGRSSSEMTIEDGVAVFKGTVSLENNGGFASTRSAAGPHDLSGGDGLLLRVRGDGHRYGVRLRTTAAFDGVSYQAEIQPPAGEWRELHLPFSAFEAVFRGRPVPTAPALDPAQVKTFGFIIAWKQEGAFRFEVARIGLYRAAEGDR